MRKLSSIVCGALLCGGMSLANNVVGNEADLKGVKPFVGYMVGISNGVLFQNGLWGGL